VFDLATGNFYWDYKFNPFVHAEVRNNANLSLVPGIDGGIYINVGSEGSFQV